jgi:hypothetical protein
MGGLGGKIGLGSMASLGDVVQDYLKHLEKLRVDAADCRLVSDLATDPAKRELFDRLALHLTTLADLVEQEMLKRKPASV